MGRPLKKSLLGNTTAAGQQISAYDPTGATRYIRKQKSSKSFLMDDGRVYILSSQSVYDDDPPAGHIQIVATDNRSESYTVIKISGRTLTLGSCSDEIGRQYPYGTKIRWVLDAATATSVILGTT